MAPKRRSYYEATTHLKADLVMRQHGVGQLHDEQTGWSSYVRVRKRSYIGRSIFRHLEDPDDEDIADDH